jgi:3'-phosphoadenosine 5'-phosphosulfate sulfotransferase (PAPS reductase)/FAD synthetase
MTENIVSFSGGKDSTAMLHLLLEDGVRVDEIIFYDTGWDFPEMIEHLDTVERRTGRRITRIPPSRGFMYLMLEHEVLSKKDCFEEGVKKGELRYKGLGWPGYKGRWCTGQKIRDLCRYVKDRSCVNYIGYSKEEVWRAKKEKGKGSFRFPLIERGVTGKSALKYCLSLGYDWGGLYDHFDRVSCVCCPFQSRSDLKKIWKYHPSVWEWMKKVQNQIKSPYIHLAGKTIHEWEEDFVKEDSRGFLELKA